MKHIPQGPWVRTIYLPTPTGSMYGIYTYIYHKNQPNVGKYTLPMDPMGHEWLIFIGTYTVPPIGSEKGMVLMVLTVEIMSYWYEKNPRCSMYGIYPPWN